MVAAVHERSDGIPLHVEEFLAAIDEDALTPQSSVAVRSAAVPDTLGDAVLSRARQLAPRTRQVASAAAVIGRSLDFDLLTAITDVSPDEVAVALRELRDAYFVLPAADAVSFDFRHALIRDALYADTDLRRGAVCTNGWPGPRPSVATAARSSRRTSNRPGLQDPPSSMRPPPRVRPP